MCICVKIDAMLNFDVDANANVTCKRAERPGDVVYCSNGAFTPSESGRISEILLMLVVYPLIFFACLMIFFAFAWCEQALERTLSHQTLMRLGVSLLFAQMLSTR